MPASIGVNMRVTGHYSQGSRKHMEDKFSVAYQQTEDERDLEYAYFGIFDGHGGCEAAAYAKDHLMEAIVRQKQFWSEDDADVLRAIRNGYMMTHMNMWKELEKWPKEIHGLPSTAGTTATVAFIRRGKIYVGHVGDSGVALGYEADGEDAWRALPLTVDHKPESEAETRRIRECGGKVMVKAGISRVVWSRRVLGNGKLCHQEIPFLAIARSLGDHWSYNAQSDEFVVSPDPDVGVVAIDPAKFRCLIFGTDGLWNMITPKEAVRSVQEAQKHNEEVAGGIRPPESWQNPSKGLVDGAIKRWANIKLQADNTTVVTVMMDPPGPPRNRAPLPQSQSTREAEKPSTAPAPEDNKKKEPVFIGNAQGDRSSTSNSTGRTERTSTAPPPPLPNVAQLEENVVNNYGNPSESYFIARLLNKTQIQNSLRHVYDEIFKSGSEVPAQPPKSEEPAHNNNNVISEVPAVKDVASPTIQPPKDTENPDDSNSALETPENDAPGKSVEEDETSSECERESIQINEVSSSSPVDSAPKLKRRKAKVIPKINDASETSRNLRSHDTPNIKAKPQTRHADKNQINCEDPGTANPPKKNIDSKVSVLVHTKLTVSRKIMIVQPQPKTFMTEPTKHLQPSKLEKKNAEKPIVKNPKPAINSSKLNNEKAEIKNKSVPPKSEVENSNAASNTRITRSRDNQSTNAESTKEVSKLDITEDSSKSSTNILISDKNKNNTSKRHKTSNQLTFPSSPKGTIKGRDQNINNNSGSFKENLSTGSQSTNLRKTSKRRHSGGMSIEQEPKEKRRTRLGDRQCLVSNKTTEEQHHDVSSTGFLLGLPVCNNVDCNVETGNIEAPIKETDKLLQKGKLRNKKDCKIAKSGTLDVSIEVHSTTLNLDSNSNESVAIRALRPRHEATTSLGKKTTKKRVLRSSICSESDEKRPILKLRNSSIPSKGTLRKRVVWPQAIRPGLRKRFTK